MDVIIDRFEGEYAVVELDTGKTINMPRILAGDAEEGDVLTIRIDKEKTKQRKIKIKSLMDELFHD